MQLENKDRVDINLQVSHLENVNDFPFAKSEPFLIKVLGNESVTLKVIMASGNEIETVFEPGWNVEICGAILDNPTNAQIQIGY